jgi:hypothetical protein
VIGGTGDTTTTAVSDEEQPLLLVTVSVGMNVPEVPYALLGAMVEDDVASPKFQL